MRRPAVLAALGLLAAVVSLAACGGSDPETVVPAYAAEITGAVTRSLVGVSVYGVVRDGGQTGFTIVMDDPGSSNSILFQKPATTKPLPGDYDIVPPDQVGPLGLYRGTVRLIIDGALEEYTAQMGTLSIVEATPTALRGTFEFDAVRTSPCCDPEPVSIHVTGTYTAAQGPVAAAR